MNNMDMEIKKSDNNIYNDGYFNGYNDAICKAIKIFSKTCNEIKSVRGDERCFFTEKNIIDILEKMIEL